MLEESYRKRPAEAGTQSGGLKGREVGLNKIIDLGSRGDIQLRRIKTIRRSRPLMGFCADRGLGAGPLVERPGGVEYF